MAEKIVFTKVNIANLAPVKKRTYYRDADSRGLVLVVSPNGTKAFEIYRKLDGKPIRTNLGRFDPTIPDTREIPRGSDPLTLIGNMAALNIRMARSMAVAVNAAMDRGENPSATKRAARLAAEQELTLRAAFEQYCSDWLVPHEKRSTKDFREIYERYLGELPPQVRKRHGKERSKSPHGVNWEKQQLSRIKSTDVRKLLISLKDGHGTHTANRTFELLRAIYRKIIEWKLYNGENPCDGVTKFKVQSRERFLTGEELPRFFEALEQSTNQNFKDFVILALTTGARRENVLSMRWGDIDFDAEIWRVPSESSKSGRAMTLPLTTMPKTILVRRMRELNARETYVFPSNSASGHMTAPKKHWAALLERARIHDLRFHDLRRSLGSWAAMTGASLLIIGKALGQQSPDATKIYARLQSDPVRNAMETATQTMFGKKLSASEGSQAAPIGYALEGLSVLDKSPY